MHSLFTGQMFFDLNWYESMYFWFWFTLPAFLIVLLATVFIVSMAATYRNERRKKKDRVALKPLVLKTVLIVVGVWVFPALIIALGALGQD